MIIMKIVLNFGEVLMMILMLIREGLTNNKQTGISISTKIMMMIQNMIESNIMKEDNLNQVTNMKIMIKLKEYIQIHYCPSHTQK